MADDEIPMDDTIKVRRGSLLWDKAWEGLGQRLIELGWGDGSDLAQWRDGTAWQLFKTVLQGDDIVHTFRHRGHPKTNSPEYVLVSRPAPTRPPEIRLGTFVFAKETAAKAGGSTDYLAKELLNLQTRAAALRGVANELFRDGALLSGERAAVDIIASYIWIARDLIKVAGEREIQREIEDNKEG